MADTTKAIDPGDLENIDRCFAERTKSQQSSSLSLDALRHVYEHKHDFPYGSYLMVLEKEFTNSARTEHPKLKMTPSLLNNLAKREWAADSVPTAAAHGGYVVVRELYHVILYLSKKLGHERNLELAKSHGYFHGLFRSLWTEPLRHAHAASVVLHSARSIRPEIGWTCAAAKWRDHLRHEFGAHENWLEWDWHFLKATYARKFHAHPPTEYLTRPEDSSNSNDQGDDPYRDSLSNLIHLGPAVVGGFQALYIKMTLDHWSPPGRHDSGESKWLLAYLEQYHRHDLSYIRHLSVVDDRMQEHIDAAFKYILSGLTTELPFDARRAREVWHQLVGRIYETDTPKAYRHTAHELRNKFGGSSKVWLEDDFRAWIHCLKVAQPQTTRVWTRAECHQFVTLREQLGRNAGKSDSHTLISIRSLKDLKEEGLFEGPWSSKPEFYKQELERRLAPDHDPHDKRHELALPPSDAAYGSTYLSELDAVNQHLLDQKDSRGIKPNEWEKDNDAQRKMVTFQWYRYHEWLLRPTKELPDKVGLARRYYMFRPLYTGLGKKVYKGLPGEKPPLKSWEDATTARRELLKRDFHLDWLLSSFEYYKNHKDRLVADALSEEHGNFEELYASLKAGKRPIVLHYSEQEYEDMKHTLLEKFQKKQKWDKSKGNAKRALQHGQSIGQHHEHYDPGPSADSQAHYPIRSITGPAFYRSLLHQFDTHRLVGDTEFKLFDITPRGALQDPFEADETQPFAGRGKPLQESADYIERDLYRCLECLAGNRYSSEQTKGVLQRYKHFRKLGEFLDCHSLAFGFVPPGGWHAAATHLKVELRQRYGRTDDWLNLNYALALAMKSTRPSQDTTPKGWDPGNFEQMLAMGPRACDYFHALHVALSQDKWTPSFGDTQSRYLADFDKWLVMCFGTSWPTKHAGHAHSVHQSNRVGS